MLLLCIGQCARSARVPHELTLEALRSREGFQWKTDRSAHFDYFYEPASPAEHDIEKIKAKMERDYADLLVLLGTGQSDFREQAFIVDSRSRMKQLSGLELNGWALGTVFAAVYGDSVNALGHHEECHLLAQHMWGETRERWLNEGLAVYSDNEWQGHPLHAIAKQLHSRRELIPIELLVTKNWNRNHYSDMVTYPEAGSFTKFLYERYGVNSVKAVWQQGAKRIPDIYGKSLLELEREWLSTIDATDSGSFGYAIR